MEDAGRGGKSLYDRMKECVKVALLSCLVNGSLMGAKYCLSEVSGSMALRADAVHSLADVIASLSILGGILIADRKTKTFPLGLYKVENLVSLFSSFFIFFAAYEIANEAIRAGNHGTVRNLGPAVVGIFCILIVTYAFSRYELKAGMKAGSPSLMADAKHIATDMLSSLVILLALSGSHLGLPLDKYAAILVVALVLYMGLTISIGSVRVLLDATLDYATLNEIRATLASHPLVKSVDSLGGRSSGRYKFVEAGLKVEARLLRDAHAVVSHLEEEILDRWPDIDRILIHYEPEQKERIKIAAPVNPIEGSQPGLDSVLSEHFGDALSFAVLNKETRTGHVALEAFVANGFRDFDRRRGVRVAELLSDLAIDEVWTRATLDTKGAGYALEALGIDIHVSEATTLRELIGEIAQGPGWTETES